MVTTIEYELIVYTFLTIMDIILGTYAHVFITKDSCSKDAKAGAMKKVVILVFMVTCVIVYDIDRFIPMDSTLLASSLLTDIKSVIVAVVAYMIYFEFVSVSANFALVTGVDLTKIPGVTNELKKKKGEI